jgi:BolA protein
LNRSQRIEQALAVLLPSILSIQDDSHKHVGHAGAQDGRGHFSILIVAPCFHGLTMLKRHRLVYQALEALLPSDIHALSIQTKTPEEYSVSTTK